MNVFEQAMDLCHSHDYHQGPEGCGPVALIEKLEEAGLLRSDVPDGDVMAFRTSGTNADVIADCFTLGYLTDEMAILDPTYGMGVFWKRHRPRFLVGTDIDPTKSPGGVGDGWDVTPNESHDFTAMQWVDGMFGAVVFDPDYKMQGTSSNEGPASSNGAYGMDREYRPVQTQLDLIETGLAECFRVTKPGGMVLVKCMAQVVSGNVVWQDFHIVDLVLQVEENRLIDRFWLLGYRKQPTHDKCRACDGTGWKRQVVDPMECPACDSTGKVPRRQVHARQNASCLLVFMKGK